MSQDKPTVRPLDLLAPATQIVSDREDYLGQATRDIGRRIADDQIELFVTGDPAFALREQLEALAPDFIAVHDVGTTNSLRALVVLAATTQARLQTLSIRRQGHGVALATLQFVEVPLADGTRLRVYSTDVNSDTRSRQQIAQVLMSHSRLTTLLVGELPRHALNAALQPLREAIARGPWPNGDLLLVPMGNVLALPGEAAQLAGRSGVSVQVTPSATGPEAAWGHISVGWNRIQARSGGSATLPSEIVPATPRAPPLHDAPTVPMSLDPPARAVAPQATQGPRPAPGLGPGTLPAPARPPTPMPIPGGVRWDDYARRCAGIKGALASCVFDLHSKRAVAHAGTQPSAERLADRGCLMMAAVLDAGRALGLGTAVQAASFTIGQHHVLLHPVPGHSGIVLHLVVDAAIGNPTLARMQLDRTPVE